MLAKTEKGNNLLKKPPWYMIKSCLKIQFNDQEALEEGEYYP